VGSGRTDGRHEDADSDETDADLVPSDRTAPRRPRSAGSVALGRVMMGLGEIIEGKPPRDAYEHVLEVDETGEPADPRSLVIDLTPTDPPT
jgi:hypothetical protein